jgi:hypothetical protein
MRERTEGLLQAMQSVLDAVQQPPRSEEKASWPRALLITGAAWAVLLVIGGAVYIALRS